MPGLSVRLPPPDFPHLLVTVVWRSSQIVTLYKILTVKELRLAATFLRDLDAAFWSFSRVEGGKVGMIRLTLSWRFGISYIEEVAMKMYGWSLWLSLMASLYPSLRSVSRLPYSRTLMSSFQKHPVWCHLKSPPCPSGEIDKGCTRKKGDAGWAEEVRVNKCTTLEHRRPSITEASLNARCGYTDITYGYRGVTGGEPIRC